MDLWSTINWIAWGLCGLLFVLMAQDFIRVELSRRGGGKS